MKRKVIALLLCIMFVCTLCFPAYADSDDSSSNGYSAIISDIPTTCPTCGAALHASWRSTAGAEVELQITESGKITIPAGAGVYAHFRLYCENCGYSKSETRILGLDWGSEHPGQWEVKQAPSGIGRKDLPGYADDNGTPNYNNDGTLQVVLYPDVAIGSTSNTFYTFPYSFNYTESSFYVSGNNNSLLYNWTASSNGRYLVTYLRYYLDCTVTGLYFNEDKLLAMSNIYSYGSNTYVSSYISANAISQKVSTGSRVLLLTQNVGTTIMANGAGHNKYTALVHPIILSCIPDTSTVNSQTNITINNNTWNGNIYVDSSNNLTYIYPEYTTINENNETITNISTNPIIYNSETNQYYTYDSTTNNYYYITYVESTPAPTPTPTPGGGSSGGGGGSGSGGSSGPSWWEKLLDKLGSALIDGLLGAISAVLKLIFKLLSTILGWIIWLVSQVLTLFPFLPPGLGALLIGGVVVCFVIGIIKFIRG